MFHVIGVVKCLAIFVWVELEDVTDLGQVLYVLLGKCLFAEVGELFNFVDLSEVLEVDTGFHEVNDWLHSFEMDLGKNRVC